MMLARDGQQNGVVANAFVNVVPPRPNIRFVAGM
jgi:hypothetical protein